PTGAAGAGVGGGTAVGAGAAGTAAAVDGEDSEDGEGSDTGGGTSAGAAVAASAATGSAAASAGGSASRRRRRLLTSRFAAAAVVARLAWLGRASLPEAACIVPGQLAGKQVDEVTSQLQDSDLKAEPKEVFDDTVPAGQVIGTEPVSGSELAPDSTVTVVVSKGEEKFAVPELEGLKIGRASG